MDGASCQSPTAPNGRFNGEPVALSFTDVVTKMFFLYAYILMTISTIGLSAFERGTRDGATRRNYNPEDFFFPVGQGIIWPLFVLTTLPYKYGIYKRETKLALNRKNEKLLRELAPHMNEVEKLLAGKRS